MAAKRQDGGKIRKILTQETLLNRMTTRIRQSLELQEILAATVAETRSFLQTDRVKVYRFQPDQTGEVIAESVEERHLPSLLHLRFPAEDIPPHAREMFIKARQRSIVDIPQQQIILSRFDPLDTTADLKSDGVTADTIADILQRPVDPCHVQYLTAMGVQSSLVMPILHQQQLWGLLVSHHASAKTFSKKQLQIVQLVANQVSIAISQSHLLGQARSKAEREALINHISTLLHAPLQIQQILQIVLERIVAAVGGSGGRLYLTEAESVYTCGIQPQRNRQGTFIEHHAFWQRWRDADTDSGLGSDRAGLVDYDPAEPLWERTINRVETITDLYQEPQLVEVASAFHDTPIRSLLLMPLWYCSHCLGYLTLFRNEVDTNIVWAGRLNADDRHSRVRDSFQAWRELKQGQTQPWTLDDIDLVRSLGTHLTMAVMQQRLFQCEREQRVLVEMRNQELHTARSDAEAASRLKSDFLASTSHELRTPLASTLNYLKLLREGFYDNEEELREYITVAHQSTENLVAIINDVLDITKIEAGRMSVSLEQVQLMPMLEEQRNLFRPESRRKNIPLVIESKIGSVYADRVKLRQILTNLLSNAFKFTNAGEVHIRCVQRSAIVEISVADTGIGIDISKRDLLFEPFVQADGSIKRRYGGTGLGLAICKRLVELMQGQIWLESLGKDQGTTVTIALPPEQVSP